MKEYDLIVIGAGSGLDVAAYAARQKGLKCALIEEGPMGGTCLNRGCIPSKMLIHAADLLTEIKRAHLFGLDVKLDSIDLKKIVGRASRQVDGEAQKIEVAIRNNPNLTLYKERGFFVGRKTLETKSGERLRAEKILIAAGTRPTRPPIEGLESVGCLTSTEALRLKRLPKSIIILGGGYISAELAHFFGSLGSKITIVDRGDRLIKREDRAISETFTELFSQKFDLIFNSTVKRVRLENGLKVTTLLSRSGEKEISAEELLIATGRRPNSDLIQAEKAEIELDEKGYIKTDQFLETSQPGLFALGDIAGKFAFKHSANLEAVYVRNNLFSEKKLAVDYAAMPHAIFSSPQVAGVGLTEEAATDLGLDYQVGLSRYKNTGMGKAIEEETGFVKVIIDRKARTILGGHILGPAASILIQEIVTAMKAAEGKISAITNSIHIHPALSEVVLRAFWQV